MKLILFFSIIILACTNSFSQSENIERTKQIAQLEKAKFNAGTHTENLSQASNNFKVNYYRCNWNIDPAVCYISGSVTSYFKTTALLSRITYDFTKQLTVDSIIFHHKPITFLQNSNATLEINFNTLLPAGKKDSVSIYYHGVPPTSGDFTGGFTQTTHSGTPIIWTLSEPYGASGWWPCRNGLDDKADSIDIYITHPSPYKASSNGILVSAVTTGSVTTSHYKHRYPIASYLVAIAVTNYTQYVTTTTIGRHLLPIIQYIYPESLSSFQSRTYLVINALQLYSKYFGDYPFINERYGQTQFGWGGGMEHQTNSFVTNSGENLMTHELGHQWFGDKVTCKSWQDIWLNEGFAAWLADMFYTEEIDTVYYKPYVQGDLANIVSQPGGSVWVDDTTNSSRIFDSRLTYNKGAFLLRMLRWTLGDSVFFKGVNAYLNDPKLAYGFARTADLQRNLEQVSGENLNYFFKQWFYGQGYPTFTLTWKQDLINHKLYFNVSEATSIPSSIKFFKVRLPVHVSNGTKSKTFVLPCINNNQDFVEDDPGFTIETVKIDPNNYLISKDNKVIKDQTLTANNISAEPANITVSPDPVVNMAIVSLKNLQGNIQLQLINNSGNIVWNRQMHVNEKSTQLQIPFSSFLNGVYKLLITEENGAKHSLTIIK